jgi:TetR/AcrR family transcriptional repressor of nem operon
MTSIILKNQDDKYNLDCQVDGTCAVGHSQEEKSENHDRIVGIASKRFRENGLEGLSVADLMHEAGLTHGGFYRHFDSRDDLVAEAVGCALAQGGERAAAIVNSDHKSAFNVLVDAYLGESHRDDRGGGCAVAALAADVARSNEPARTAYTQQVRRYLDLILAALKRGEAEATRQQSVLTLSALVGALSLARAVNDEKLSLEILKSTARALKV